MTTNNIGAMDAQADGMRIYHVVFNPERGKATPEHYYFPTLEALKLYVENEMDAHDWTAWVYIMEIGEDGHFVDTWECMDLDAL